MKHKITNPELIHTIKTLKRRFNETEAALWNDLAKRLIKNKHDSTNLSNINRNTKMNDIIAVPGKVLGAGKINHPLKVAAFNFSKKAREKIINAGGECLTLLELSNRNIKSSDIKIIK
jgi:large subunit ribosomal protein L18e